MLQKDIFSPSHDLETSSTHGERVKAGIAKRKGKGGRIGRKAKLSKKAEAEVRDSYRQGRATITELAKRYAVDRRTIYRALADSDGGMIGKQGSLF